MSRLAIASQSGNEQGFLIEGEVVLTGGMSYVAGKPFSFNFSKMLKVPDRAGEFLLIVDYFAGDEESVTPRRFAIVCPVVLK